ncbi:MAG: hypothetical protein AB1420_07885 [Bacillota bacterium]
MDSSSGLFPVLPIFDPTLICLIIICLFLFPKKPGPVLPIFDDKLIICIILILCLTMQKPTRPCGAEVEA